MDQMTETALDLFHQDWRRWSGPGQCPPDGDWRVWIFMGGRGAGKTRAGAEWVRAEVEAGRARRIALIGPTLSDVREVMIEGPSGLAQLGGQVPRYAPSRRRLTWPNGAQAYAFSAEDPDSLRGPQFDLAWVDEIAVWPHAEAVWDMLQFGLRLGTAPRVCVTTTPRPNRLIKRLVADPGVALTRARTEDNPFLSDAFQAAVHARYGATALGRQELEGELISDPPGALFTRTVIEANRVEQPPPLDLVLVAVDPPATTGPSADACGIVAVGAAFENGRRVAFVLADASVQGLAPLDWASRAVALADRLQADTLIAEANQGGEMVREVLKLAGGKVPIRLVRATRSKTARAEPVAALYQQGRVRHVGAFRDLEDQLCAFGADMTGSPDRVDALVWAITDLCLRQSEPRLSRL